MEHDRAISAVSFSPDGTKIATASNDHTARLWDAATHKPLGASNEARCLGPCRGLQSGRDEDRHREPRPQQRDCWMPRRANRSARL